MVDFEKARRTMVDTQLRPSSMQDRRILQIMGEVPRERFVPEGRKALAYVDVEHDLNAANGRMLPTATSFARLVQLAQVRPEDVVLDIACGLGYSTAVLAGLGSAVVGVEDDDELVASADAKLTELEIGNAAVVKAPLTIGVPKEAPFDVIVIEGEVDEVPHSLLALLRDGGRLVVYRRRGHQGVATVFTRVKDEFAERAAFDASMPFLAAFARVPEFAF